MGSVCSGAQSLGSWSASSFVYEYKRACFLLFKIFFIMFIFYYLFYNSVEL